MIKRIIFKVKDITRTHSRDPRIQIDETILELVKTIGFNWINEKQDGIGYIWGKYVMMHHQKNKKTGHSLDSWASKDKEPKDYDERCEDFKKLMKNIDVPDDDIKGPYDRDEYGKKLIGDVRKHWFQEEEMGRIEFSRLCRNAERSDCLIEIQYEEGKIDE